MHLCSASIIFHVSSLNLFQLEYFSWDEWISESRILKYNDTNVQLQKEVALLHKADKSGAKSKKGTSKLPITKTDKPGIKDPDSRSSTPSKEVLGKETPTLSRSRGSKSSNSSTTPATSKDPAKTDDGPSDVKKRRIRLDTETQSLNGKQSIRKCVLITLINSLLF